MNGCSSNFHTNAIKLELVINNIKNNFLSAVAIDCNLLALCIMDERVYTMLGQSQLACLLTYLLIRQKQDVVTCVGLQPA